MQNPLADAILEGRLSRGDRARIDFENGVARSKITPAVLDRLAGSSVTMRNVRTLDALIELAKS